MKEPLGDFTSTGVDPSGGGEGEGEGAEGGGEEEGFGVVGSEEGVWVPEVSDMHTASFLLVFSTKKKQRGGGVRGVL